MRLTGVMNDHSEVQHGLDCLSTALRPWTPACQQLTNSLDGFFPGLYQEVMNLFELWKPNIFSNTFIACISELYSEDRAYGKLSMWRAYGGNAGVAFVLSPKVFFQKPKHWPPIQSLFYIQIQKTYRQHCLR
jgi:hypothetical protein